MEYILSNMELSLQELIFTLFAFTCGERLLKPSTIVDRPVRLPLSAAGVSGEQCEWLAVVVAGSVVGIMYVVVLVLGLLFMLKIGNLI